MNTNCKFRSFGYIKVEVFIPIINFWKLAAVKLLLAKFF